MKNMYNGMSAIAARRAVVVSRAEDPVFFSRLADIFSKSSI